MESVIGFTPYLESRRFNRKLLNKIGQHITPIINVYNVNNPDDMVDVNWSMSAKHQQGTVIVTMSSGNDITPTADSFVIYTLSYEFEDWFGCGFDEDDVNETYISAMIGF